MTRRTTAKSELDLESGDTKRMTYLNVDCKDRIRPRGPLPNCFQKDVSRSRLGVLFAFVNDVSGRSMPWCFADCVGDRKIALSLLGALEQSAFRSAIDLFKGAR